MKYIPADKLIAEIERRKEILDKYRDSFETAACCEQELEWIKEFITSLQQEQLEGLHFTPLYRLIQKIPSKNWNNTINNYAKKLRDCLIKEGYLTDATVLQGYISYMNGNNVPMAIMDEQEQPEVDLEKALDEYYKNADFGPSEAIEYEIHKDIARHFYELARQKYEK